MTIRKFTQPLTLLFALCLIGSGVAHAQPRIIGAYPHPRVTLVTEAKPGERDDLLLRDLAKFLGLTMGVNFVVENMGDASGATAIAYVSKAPPDGSVFYATNPTYIQTSILSKPEIGYGALDPIANVFQDPEVIYTRADSPSKSLKEAFDLARKNSGKSQWGAGTSPQERAALGRIARKENLKVSVVPNVDRADIITSVLNGTFDIAIGEVQELEALLQAGKIRVLAALTQSRLPFLPSVTTAHEQGVNVVIRKFRGLAGPKGIPQLTITRIEAGLARALETEDYRGAYSKSNLLPAFMGRIETGKFMADVASELTESMKELGVIK